MINETAFYNSFQELISSKQKLFGYVKKTIYLFPGRDKALLTIPFPAVILYLFCSTKITIIGTVISDKNTPLPDVSVKVEGQSTGITTQANGSFTLHVNKGATLVFSIMGYEEKRIKANEDGPALQVQLNSKASSLNEVVVVGYGTQQKRDLTGSVSTIDQKAIADLPVSTIDQKMIGQVAGVQTFATNRCTWRWNLGEDSW